jgi:hypothetical protein
MASDLDVVFGKIQSTWQEFEGLPGRVDQNYQAGMRFLDDHSTLLGDVAVSLRPVLTQLRDAIIKAWNWIHDVVKDAYHSYVDGYEVLQQMPLHRDSWLAVRNQAFDAGARLLNPEQRLEKYWTGQAADKYYKVIDPQNTAARRVGELAQELSDSLTSMISAGTAFSYALYTYLAFAVGLLIAAILALASVVAAPAAIPTLGATAAATAAFLYATKLFADAQSTDSSKLTADATNPTGFGPGPAWPRSSVPTDVDPHNSDPVDWIPVPQPAPAP